MGEASCREQPIWPTDWQDKRCVDAFLARIKPIVTDAAKRDDHLFKEFPDHDIKDLFQEAMMAVCKAGEENKYDPSRSTPTTFIHLVVHRRLLTIRRGLLRRVKREQETMPAETILIESKYDDDESLVMWLANTYRTINRNLNAYIPQSTGRPGYTTAQRMTLLALVNRLNLSCRGAVELLNGKRELLTAMHMSEVPSRNIFSNLRKSVTKLLPPDSAANN